jgi:N-acetyl-beta-hexosaminidase
MEFKIPKNAEAPLAEFVRLGDGQVKRLVEALCQTKPTLLPTRFAQEVAAKAGLSEEKVAEILSMFGGMYMARIDAEKALEEFVSDLSNALQKSGNESLQARNWLAFEQNVKSILASEDSLGITAKALDLLVDHEHTLHAARIVTDVRYIFASDPTQRPKAAVIAHMLNLVYHEIDDLKLTFWR